MVFRIPTQLESFPSSNGRSAPHRRPWRDNFIVTGLHPSDRDRADYIQVSAVETDGDKSQLWPTRVDVRPVRLSPQFHETGLASFRTLSKTSSENSEVGTGMKLLDEQFNS